MTLNCPHLVQYTVQSYLVFHYALKIETSSLNIYLLLSAQRFTSPEENLHVPFVAGTKSSGKYK